MNVLVVVEITGKYVGLINLVVKSYQLKYLIWNISIKDREYSINMEDVESLNIEKMLPIISAKNKTFQKLKIDNMKDKYKSY